MISKQEIITMVLNIYVRSPKDLSEQVVSWLYRAKLELMNVVILPNGKNSPLVLYFWNPTPCEWEWVRGSSW